MLSSIPNYVSDKFNSLVNVLQKIDEYVAVTISYLIYIIMSVAMYVDWALFPAITMSYITLSMSMVPIIPVWLTGLLLIAAISSTSYYEIKNYIVIMKMPIIAALYLILSPFSTLSIPMVLLACLVAIGVGVLIDSFITSMLILLKTELIKHLHITKLQKRYGSIGKHFDELLKIEAATRCIKPAFSRLESIVVFALAILSGMALFKAAGAAIISASAPYALAILSSIGLGIVVFQAALTIANRHHKFWLTDHNDFNASPALFAYIVLTGEMTFKKKAYLVAAISLTIMLSFFLLSNVPFTIAGAPTAVAFLAATSFGLITKVTLDYLSPTIRGVSYAIINKLSLMLFKKPITSSPKQNPHINDKVFNGLTPFEIAVSINRPDLAEALTNAGAEIPEPRRLNTTLSPDVYIDNLLLNARTSVHEGNFQRLRELIDDNKDKFDTNRAIFVLSYAERVVGFKRIANPGYVIERNYLQIALYLLYRVDLDSPLNLGELAIPVYEARSRIPTTPITDYIKRATELFSEIVFFKSWQEEFKSYKHLLTPNGGARSENLLRGYFKDCVAKIQIRDLSLGFGDLRDESMPAITKLEDLKDLKDKPARKLLLNIKKLPEDVLSCTLGFIIDFDLLGLKIGNGVSPIGVLKCTQPLARAEMEAKQAASAAVKASGPSQEGVSKAYGLAAN